MNKLQLSEKGKKRAAAGIVVCFIAAIVFTGTYTWKNYQKNLEEELRAEEESRQSEDVPEEELWETNSDVEKEEEATTEEEKETMEHATYTESTAVVQPNFTNSSQLLWPVNGNVIMSYSMDKAIYFSTLDQYKYNPALIISGAVNDNVIASASGVVKSIDDLRETGITVNVDLGNGYECFYGQLADVQVKVGDYIQTKDVIGYVGEPTKYYSVEGANLYFEMRKDGQPVNPLDYMGEE